MPDLSINIQASKNTAIPLLYCAAAIRSRCTLDNFPIRLIDVQCTINSLRLIGAHIANEDSKLYIDSTNISFANYNKDICSSTRYSLLYLGLSQIFNVPLSINIPGGCELHRSHDMHVDFFNSIGSTITESNSIISILPRIIHSNIIYTLRTPSVGTTLNCLLASISNLQSTTINNISIEPEVISCIEFLKKFNVSIKFTETRSIILNNQEKKPEYFYCPSDRIVTISYIVAAILAKVPLILKNVPLSEIKFELEKINQIDDYIITTPEINTIQLKAVKSFSSIFNPQLEATAYPGIATDALPLLAILHLHCYKVINIKDSIYFNRYDYLYDLKNMGLISIEKKDDWLICKELQVTMSSVKITIKDIRGGMAKLLYCLSRGFLVRIVGTACLQRGYENIDRFISLFDRAKKKVVYE